MRAEASFDMEVVGNLIKVDLSGQWTVHMDLKYVSELSETMATMRDNSWAVLVDMRGWHVPKSVYQSDLAFKLNLDRRNQMLECWVVDEPDQAEFIMPLFEQANLMPKRCFDIASAAKVLEQHGFRV